MDLGYTLLTSILTLTVVLHDPSFSIDLFVLEVGCIVRHLQEGGSEITQIGPFEVQLHSLYNSLQYICETRKTSVTRYV